MLQHRNQFFVEIGFEYFGTTKCNCYLVDNETIADPNQKVDPFNKIVFIGQKTDADLHDVIRTTEYLSRNLSPSCTYGLETDLLNQVQQAIANLSKSN